MSKDTEAATTTIDEADEKAKKAVLDAISEGIAGLYNNGYKLSQQASTVREFALAYRYIAGGDQPQTISTRVSK